MRTNFTQDLDKRLDIWERSVKLINNNPKSLDERGKRMGRAFGKRQQC